MAEVSLKQLSKSFDKTVVIEPFSLTIPDKAFVVLVGPSGCGKSTILRMIAGLETPSSGSIEIAQHVVNDVSPKDRDIAMVFQNYALYPHMTVFENMAFGLKMRKTPKAEIKSRVETAAKILELDNLLDRKPKQLSGGQRQRVALGRAIVRNPKVFLMDEPLSNLDAKLRAHTRSEILNLHRQLEATTIYVTHDQVEAMTMGDLIVILNQGKIQQVGAPQDIYKTPQNPFVGGFIGQMAFITADVKEKQFKFSGFFWPLPGQITETYAAESILIGIRPEHFILDSNGFTVTPTLVEHHGNELRIHFKVDDTAFIATLPPETDVQTGHPVKLSIKTESLSYFDPKTQANLQP